MEDLDARSRAGEGPSPSDTRLFQRFLGDQALSPGRQGQRQVGTEMGLGSTHRP